MTCHVNVHFKIETVERILLI